MLTVVGQLNSLEEATDYDRRIADWFGKLGSGCVSTRPCYNCFSLISDSICLCMPVFECPKCGYENGKGLYESFKNTEIYDNSILGSLIIGTGVTMSHDDVLVIENLEEQIRTRAYFLWEQAGRPDSGELEFWVEAEKEYRGEVFPLDFLPVQSEDDYFDVNDYLSPPGGGYSKRELRMRG